MSFRALVVVGNAKGSGGFGVGKAMLVSIFALVMRRIVVPFLTFERAPFYHCSRPMLLRVRFGTLRKTSLSLTDTR